MSLDPVDHMSEREGFYAMTFGFMLLLVAFLVMFAKPEGEETWGAVSYLPAAVGVFAVLFGSEAVGVESGQDLLLWSTSVFIAGVFAVLAVEFALFNPNLTHFGTAHLTTQDLGIALIDTAVVVGAFGILQDARRWYAEDILGDPEDEVDLDDDW